MASSSTLPQSLLNPRRHVGIHAERVSDVSSTEYPGHYPNEDHSWDLQKFKQVCTYYWCCVLRICANSITRNSGLKNNAQNLQVKVQRLSQRSIEFDLVGVDASIANAFRRIMIAEVRSRPTLPFTPHG